MFINIRNLKCQGHVFWLIFYSSDIIANGLFQKEQAGERVEDKFLKIPTRIFCFLNLPMEI